MIRNAVSLQPRGFKAKAVATFGGQEFKDLLSDQGLLTNSDFEGIYDFGDDPPYGQHMQHWLARTAARALIVCHPAIPGYRVDNDPIAAARSREYRFLMNDPFPASLSLLGVGLMPFNARLLAAKKKSCAKTA